MKCPACSNELKPQVVNGVTLDVCAPGCGGIWFDQFEFKKFDEKIEPDVEKLISLPSVKAVQGNPQVLHQCPRCKSGKMQRHFSSVQKKVMMDTCAQCGGVWLDAGELTTIRDEFKTEDERRKAADKIFGDMFDSQIAAATAKSGADASRAGAYARAFKFICPSFYIKGKQGGGAF